MGIKEILTKYDNPNFKAFDERDLNSELNRLTGQSQDAWSVEDQGELMAFGFCEDYGNKKAGWGTYFGPMFVINNGDGSASESPSIRLVTEEMLTYWLERARTAQNPIMIARYSGLVWDFTQFVTKKKPPVEAAHLYITAVNRIATESYYKVELYVFTKLKKALSIAIFLNDKDFIEQCKNTLIAFENLVSKDNLPGIWGYAFDLLVFNKKVQLSQEEEKSLIDELEAKLDRLLIAESPTLKDNIWAAQNAATRLADYYRKKTDKENVKRVIIKFVLSSELASKTADISQIAANTEYLYKLLIKYGLKDEAAEMLLKVREASSKVPAAMKRIGAEIEIPTDKIRQYLDGMTADGLSESLYRLLITYIPVQETAAEQLRTKARENPISYLFTQQLLDGKGRVIATIAPLEEDFESHLIKDIALNLHLQSITLKFLIDELINKYGLNSSDILDLLKDCPVISEERRKIIEKGLDAYFAGDFIVAIHLIIPQIEEAMRNIVEMAGGNVLKESRGGGFHLRTFDDILRDEIIETSLDPEMTNYFKILFTDQKGWNLRNNVCHGTTDFEGFNFQTADRVFHALLCLSLIIPVD